MIVFFGAGLYTRQQSLQTQRIDTDNLAQRSRNQKKRILPQSGTEVKKEEDHRVKLLNDETQKNQEKWERGKT